MIRLRPPWRALLVMVVVFTSACGDGPQDQTRADAATSVANEPAPADWQEMSFPGGTFAAPPDWAETDPMGKDDLTVFGPEVDDRLPFAVRVRTSDRDALPFEHLAGVWFASLFLQLEDVEALGEEPMELPGAEEAVIVTVRYEEPVDGDTVTIEERAVIAWFGGDRQLQLRIAAPIDLLDDESSTIGTVLDTIDLEEG